MSLSDRYSLFKRKNIPLINIPFIKIRERVSDKREAYIEGRTTFDKLAFKWYGREDLGYIISMGNPEYIDENDIESGEIVRIPFPLNEVENEIRKKVELYKIQ